MFANPPPQGDLMKSRRFIRSVAMALVCLLLSSCEDSKNPLSDPEKAAPDAEFVGVWRSANDGSADYYHVAAAGGKLPAGVLRMISVSHAKNGVLARPGEMLAFSTILGEDRYLNVASIDDKELDQFEKAGWKPELVKGYFIIKYQVQGDTLKLWTMERDARRKAIESGKIKGTIDKKTVLFTDTTENLAALLASPDGISLFDKEASTCERVK